MDSSGKVFVGDRNCSVNEGLELSLEFLSGDSQSGFEVGATDGSNAGVVDGSIDGHIVGVNIGVSQHVVELSLDSSVRANSDGH